MTISKAERLRRFYKVFDTQDRVLTVINADPDSIASAKAVKRLLWRRVASFTISNINVIKRPDNMEMVRLLGLNLIHTDEIRESDYNRFVIVDSQPDHHESFQRFEFDVVIDHHPQTWDKAPFTDIRSGYGATATIMTEYIRAGHINPSGKLAAALFHAIKIDTMNFERKALPEDMRAFQFLFKHANIHMARKMEQADLTMDFLRYFGEGIAKKRFINDKMYAHLGEVVNPDVCVLVADFFMRICTVKWSVVSGIYDNRLIIIFRNDGMGQGAGKKAKDTFGHLGSAGGHKSAARAEIPLEDVKRAKRGNNKPISHWITDMMEKKRKIRGKK